MKYKIKILMNPNNIICVKADKDCFIRNDEVNVLDYDDESGDDIMFVIRLYKDRHRNLYIFASDIVKLVSDQSYIPVYADTFKNTMYTAIMNMGEDVQCILYHLIIRGAERNIVPKNEYIAYKATNEDYRCLNKHYDIHTKYKEDGCIICSKGIHACMCPLDCFTYYSPNRNNKYFAGHGILEDTYCGIYCANTKSVFSEFTLDEELDIDSIIRKSKDYISKYGHYAEYDKFFDDVISERRDYSYVISKNVGLVFGGSSIAEVFTPGSVSSTFGSTSIAKCNSICSTAIAHNDKSIAYSAADYSVSLSYILSRAISKGDYSIAASYNDGLSITDGEKSIAEVIGGSEDIGDLGSAITNDRKSVSVGISAEEVICKEELSVAVGIDVESIKVEGNGSVAVAQGSFENVNVASNSVAVLMLHRYDHVNFIGGKNSYIMINLLDGNNEIRSSKTLHIDGKRILPGVTHTYNAIDDTIVVSD